MKNQKRTLNRTYPRLTLWLLIGVFVGPFVLALALFQNNADFEFMHGNYGDLVTPIKSIQALDLINLKSEQNFDENTFNGRWSLVYFVPKVCDQNCQDMIYDLRQVHVALGKNAPRISRVVIHPIDQVDTTLVEFIDKNYDGVLQAKSKPELITKVLETPSYTGSLFLSDPMGGIMMHYPENLEGKKLLGDLKRLMKVSQIG
jgi:hypothetical protein